MNRPSMSQTDLDSRDRLDARRTKAETETSGRNMGSWLWGILGAAALWLSFPPVGWWPLAWLAPLPWMTWVYRARWDVRRPYRMVWVIGTLYWLATFYFIPLPHPALWLGWLVVSAYMGLYLCLFVALSRVWIHRWRFSPGSPQTHPCGRPGRWSAAGYPRQWTADCRKTHPGCSPEWRGRYR